MSRSTDAVSRAASTGTRSGSAKNGATASSRSLRTHSRAGSDSFIQPRSLKASSQ